MGTNWNILTPTTKPSGHMKGQPCEENCVAYCHCYKHRGGLSKDMMKQHECLKKGCRYLEKYEDHPYWGKKKYINHARKENRSNRNVQGVSGKVKTGSNVNSRASRLNTDFKDLLKSFEDMDIFYAYIFYKNDLSKIRYLGGYYEKGTAMDKAKEISDNEGGDYIVIANDADEPVGFRLEPTIRSLIEIDLTWSKDYASFSDRVVNDITLKKAANII
ncbi:MAG: hypothetical protein II842_00640 [Butyrivibrio sp.]|nr:hypothetical protein [uncultured Butyrivibrio sp.]MBQ3794789.1 hypothetical protein [Butyrivibrio sp.]